MSYQIPATMVGDIVADSIAVLQKRLATQRDLTLSLLQNVGERAQCRGCHAWIYWVRHRVTHKNTPYDADGLNHFATCPNANQFRKPKENHHE